MRIRRLSDIKTHGTLDRKGLLVGVAKNMHKLGSHNGTEDAENSSNWNVERHIYKKDESSKKVSAKVIPPSKGLLSSLSEVHSTCKCNTKGF